MTKARSAIRPRANETVEYRVLGTTREAIDRLAKEHGKRAGEIVDEAVGALLIRLHEGAYCKHPGCFSAPLGLSMGRGMLVADFAKPYCMVHVPKPTTDRKTP